MKKLFTLLCAAVAGLSASAYTVPEGLSMHGLTPQGEAVMQQSKMISLDAQATPDGRRFIGKRTWSNDKYIFNVLFYNMGYLTDVVLLTMQDGSSATFEDLPFYAVQAIVYRTPISTPDKYDTMVTNLVTWPSYRCGYTEESLEGMDPMPANIDNILPINEFLNNPDPEHAGYGLPKYKWLNLTVEGGYSTANLFPSEDGYWPIWSPLFGTQQAAQSMVSGVQDMIADGTEFEITDYDANDDNFLEMPFTFFFEKSAPFMGNYSGSCEAYNMVTRTVNMGIENIHVFNAGMFTKKDYQKDFPYGFGYPNDNWSPVQGWYFGAIAAEGGEIVVDLADGTKMRFDPQYVKFSVPDPNNKKSYNYIMGGFWTGNDQFKNQTITLTEGEDVEVPIPGSSKKVNVLGANPKAGIALPWGYKDYPWSVSYGLQLAYEGLMSYLNAGSAFAFGTKDGFSFSGKDSAGNTYYAHMKDGVKLVLHNDPADMFVSEEVDIRGDYEFETGGSGVQYVADEKASISAANGVISVVAENAAAVAVYNLSGARVAAANIAAGEVANFNVEKGVYIVKVGKTAKKVIL